MRKIILQSLVGVFSFAIITSCSKDVKAPANKPAVAAKPSATSSPVAENSNPGAGESNNGCGSHSGSSGSSSSDTYTNGY